MNDTPEVAPEGGAISLRVPTNKPRWTYVLIACNVLVFVVMTAFGLLVGLGLGGSQNTAVLRLFGAQDNILVGQGDYYRLFTSMFIHIGLVHLAFNTWALYVIGQGLERLYGAARFLAIYLLSGLGGSLVSFVLAPANVSAGASGAIFGLIGAEVAFFYRHRKTFGQASQQLRSLLMVAGLNLVLGFTFPGINNYAHIGGLLFGALLGWFLAPQYQAPSVLVFESDATATLEDRNHIGRQLPAMLLVLALLSALLYLGTLRWG